MIGRWLLMLAALLAPAPALALDPPHDVSFGIECLTCHVPHGAAGAPLAAVEGNANLCLSCHTPGGQAAPRALADADQAFPGFSGNSHRWDSGPSGHVRPVAGLNSSTGVITSGGRYTGKVGTTYTLTITAAGASGVASFSYVSDFAGSGAGLLSGNDVALERGLRLRFTDGAGVPAFKAGDQWKLYVQPDLRYPVSSDPDWSAVTRPVGQRVMPQQLPFNTELGQTWAKTVCSTCHDQHSQRRTPFDPNAPAYGGSGTGAGRHFQRIDNQAQQLCLACHSPRNVTSSAGGSHPVGVTIPAHPDFQTPAGLPLSTGGEVVCMTCHAPHSYSGVTTDDGYLLRLGMEGSTVCLACHTLADTGAGSHFDAASGVLWPGGQYGSSFPASPPARRGACVNCHWPHGWPDDAATVDLDGNGQLDDDYPRLWVEQYDLAADRSDPADAEDLCYTCHDGAPGATDIRADFLKGTNGSDIFHHPVSDPEQTPGRSVECVDCHNPHTATPDNRHAGVTGTALDGAPVPVTEATQFTLCFNCHGDSYNAARANTSNKRSDFGTGNSAYHPVAQAGRNQSANLAAQLAGAGLDTGSTIRCTDCHNSDAFAATSGPIIDTPALTQGPHGSTFAPILRAGFSRNYTATSGWSSANAALCFRCHAETLLLAEDRDAGARTNFDDDLNGKGNLHWVHLTNRDTTASCMSCHYDVHSNRSAANTQYRINGTLYPDNASVSAARIKTHMVNFAPDITAIGGRSKPEWWLNTSTGERRCYLACHGETMNGAEGGGGSKVAEYRPAAGDETVWTY